MAEGGASGGVDIVLGIEARAWRAELGGQSLSVGGNRM
jgi:hypothetical protein